MLNGDERSSLLRAQKMFHKIGSAKRRRRRRFKNRETTRRWVWRCSVTLRRMGGDRIEHLDGRDCIHNTPFYL